MFSEVYPPTPATRAAASPEWLAWVTAAAAGDTSVPMPRPRRWFAEAIQLRRLIQSSPGAFEATTDFEAAADAEVIGEAFERARAKWDQYLADTRSKGAS